MGVQGVNGLAVAAAGGGLIFIWSGLKGARATGTLRSLLSGTNPQAANDYPVGTPTGPAGFPSGTTGPGADTNPGHVGPGETGWSTAFLKAIGAPGTNANIVSVNAWQAREGGGGQNNPLNTTLACCGATGSINSAGVKNYPTVADGVSANAKTLLGGGYGDILLALKSGRGLCGQSFAGLSRWSSGGYSSVC